MYLSVRLVVPHFCPANLHWNGHCLVKNWHKVWFTANNMSYLKYPAVPRSFRIKETWRQRALQWLPQSSKNMSALIESYHSAPHTRAPHLNPSAQSLSINFSFFIDSGCWYFWYVKGAVKIHEGYAGRSAHKIHAQKLERNSFKSNAKHDLFAASQDRLWLSLSICIQWIL